MSTSSSNTCTWTFQGGVWTAVDNCSPGFNCTGPLPLGPPGSAPQAGFDANGVRFMMDGLFRAQMHSLHPTVAIPAPAATPDGTTVTLPCSP